MNNKDEQIKLLMQAELEADKRGIFNCSTSKLKAEIICDFLQQNDVVKVIKCENCKFFVDVPNARKFQLVAEGYDGLCVLKGWDDKNRHCMSTHNDDFCSLAEKR